MQDSFTPPPRVPDATDRRIRRAWWIFAGSFVVLGVIVLARLLVGGASLADFVVGGLVLVVGATAIVHREAVAGLEAGRRVEAESFARILSSLSRSVSPDAIVGAIVDELADATGADHIVVARRRADARVLEARLVSARPGVPDSTTLLPIGDLEDPLPDHPPAPREPIAIPIEADEPVHVPVPVGVGAGVRGRIDDMAARLAVATPGLRAGHGPHGEDGVRQPGDRQRIADRIAARTRTVYGLNHTLAAPLTADGTVVGAIILSHRTAGAWSPATRRILAGAAVEASAALVRVTSHQTAEVHASTDALTGLPNRRYFDEFCGLLARRRRAGDAIGVLMIDIDRFKVLNDTHGHHTGDEVLRAVGGAIVSAVREDDVPARYGGEEFVVLLRNPSPDVAFDVGERVRAAVGALDLHRLGVAAVSVSVGVAVAAGADQPIGDVIKAADRALYRAKRSGRDRVVAA